jgi:hypothetical protein
MGSCFLYLSVHQYLYNLKIALRMTMELRGHLILCPTLITTVRTYRNIQVYHKYNLVLYGQEIVHPIVHEID